MKNLKAKSKTLVFCILTALIYTYAVVFTKDVGDGVRMATERCINIIIPSLFIYMIMSAFITETGIYKFLFKPLKHLSKYIFAVPCELFFVFVLGNICGYPIGIKLLDDLYSESRIDLKTAKCLSCSCYGGGPSFLISIVGTALYNDESIGLVIFLSCLLSNAALAIILNRVYKPQIYGIDSQLKKPDIISIISGSAKGIFKICAVIIAFSFVSTTLDSLSFMPSGSIGVAIKSAFEITNLTQLTAPNTKLLPLIAALSSFGGLCIILQLKAIARLTLKPILLSRIIACPLSALFCFAFIKIFGIKSAVYTASFNITHTDISVLGLVLTVILAVFFIFTQENKKRA